MVSHNELQFINKKSFKLKFVFVLEEIGSFLQKEAVNNGLKVKATKVHKNQNIKA